MPSRLARRLLLCLALTAGCAESTAILDTQITAQAQPAGILITNGSPFRVYYWAYEPGFLATANTVSVDCNQAGACPSLEGHSQVVVPWHAVMGFNTARWEYWVAWRAPDPQATGTLIVNSGGVTAEP